MKSKRPKRARAAGRLASTLARERTTQLEADFAARLAERKAEQTVQELEAARKQEISDRYWYAARETLYRIWNLCGWGSSAPPPFWHPLRRRTFGKNWGTHRYEQVNRNGSWVDACVDCELPKDGNRRSDAITQLSRELMEADRAAGVLASEDVT